MINAEVISAELKEHGKEILQNTLKSDRERLKDLYIDYRSMELKLEEVAVKIEDTLRNIELTKNRIKGETNV